MSNTEMRSPQDHDASADVEPVATDRAGFKNILCAVDGTRGSMAAVAMAAALTGPDGHLTLLAVTAVTGSGADEAAAISPSRAERVLRDAQRTARQAGVACSAVLDPGGPPVEVILERAVSQDLLVIGAPAGSRLVGMIVGGLAASFGGRLAGGVAAPALSRLTTPVLFVRDGGAGPLRGRRILVASDGEDGSERLVELAGAVGAAQGARVTLVNAIVTESKISPRAIEAQGRKLEAIAPGSGEPLVEPGKPWDVILGAARNTDAALVVIGSRGLGGLRAFGSVSRRVVHDAPCSVLVAPPAR